MSDYIPNEQVRYIRIFKDSDGWTIDGIDGLGGYTEDVWCGFKSISLAKQAIEDFRQDIQNTTAKLMIFNNKINDAFEKELDKVINDTKS